jgi:hypothetical protein
MQNIGKNPTHCDPTDATASEYPEGIISVSVPEPKDKRPRISSPSINAASPENPAQVICPASAIVCNAHEPPSHTQEHHLLDPCQQCGSNRWAVACGKCARFINVATMSDIITCVRHDSALHGSAHEPAKRPQGLPMASKTGQQALAGFGHSVLEPLEAQGRGFNHGHKKVITERPTYLDLCQACKLSRTWVLGCQRCRIRWRLCCMAVVYYLVNEDSERHAQDIPCGNCKNFAKYATSGHNCWQRMLRRR